MRRGTINVMIRTQGSGAQTVKSLRVEKAPRSKIVAHVRANSLHSCFENNATGARRPRTFDLFLTAAQTCTT